MKCRTAERFSPRGRSAEHLRADQDEHPAPWTATASGHEQLWNPATGQAVGDPLVADLGTPFTPGGVNGVPRSVVREA